MNILHVIPAFYPAYLYGGPIESSYQLCHHLARNGCEVRVLTTDANGLDSVMDVQTERDVILAKHLSVRYCKRQMRHAVSFELMRLLPSYIRWADVVHLTAIYSFTTLPTLSVCKALGKPMVWSPRGSLQRWDGSTRPMLKALWEWICIAIAPKWLILHVTSPQEARDTRQRFSAIQVVIIPNGVEIPETVSHAEGDGALRLLYLGRLHPIKGIENLLAGCRALTDRSDAQWSLTLAGVGDTRYTRALYTRIQELESSKNVTFVGQVEGEAKRRLFENTDVVVIPSYRENFGMVVAEALAHSVPVITSTGTPWQRVQEMGCGLWVENEPDSLAEAIERIRRMPLYEMGQKGRSWMQSEFVWERRAREMIECYERARGGTVSHAM